VQLQYIASWFNKAEGFDVIGSLLEFQVSAMKQMIYIRNFSQSDLYIQ